ncbi:MAG: TetR/AcrR family transcriptional regulator [Deltaproteobacteria bacterium]|nr:TetR/AcrR family transcriptional regulator [Deltaproteobacteria bacterium]
MPLVRATDRLRPRKRPRQARSQRTVDAIVKAAAQVFSRRGYAGTTTNHIAERAGVSIGSLYEYFPSKDALLAAIMEAHIAEAEAVLTRAAAEVAGRARDLGGTIRHLVRAMIALHARDRELHRVLFEEAPLSRRLRQALREVEERIVGWVVGLLDAHPEVRVADVPLAAAIVVRTVEALTHNLVLHGQGDAPVEAYTDEIVRLATRYLGPAA